MPLLQDNAGLNITGTKLQLVEVNIENDKLLVENVDEEPIDDYLTADLPDTDFIEALQQPFNNLISRKPLYSKRISFTLPDEYFKIFKFPLEKSLTREDFKAHISWEFSVTLPDESLTDFSIQTVEFPITELSPVPNVLVYAVKKELLKTLKKFAVSNNLELKFIDNAHAASNSFIHSENGTDKFYLSIYLYEKRISIILLKGNRPIYRSSPKMASKYIIESILASEITKLNDLGITLAKISKCYTAGENLPQEQIDQVQEATGALLIPFNPFENIKTAPTISSSKFVNELSNSFTSAAGIALRLL